MQKLTIMRSEGCLRLLDHMLKHGLEQEHSELTLGLVDKLVEQCQVLSVQMHDNQLTRALYLMTLQMPLADTPEKKRKIAERTQFFVDRYVDFLVKNGDGDTNNVFHAHKFMREV